MFDERVPYIFREKSSTQVVADRTFTNVAWDSTPSSYLTTASTAGFTVDVPGVYLINASAFYTAEAGFDGCMLTTASQAQYLYASAGSDETGTGNSTMYASSVMLRLAKNATVQIQVYTIVNPASSTVVGSAVVGAEMFLTAQWIGKY